MVYVSPNTVREAVALEPETFVLAVGGTPGEPFEPRSWEDFQVAFAEASSRGRDEARALIADRLAGQDEDLAALRADPRRRRVVGE